MTFFFIFKQVTNHEVFYTSKFNYKKNKISDGIQKIKVKTRAML